jgi:RimJ/RimL family protein N-acetyltransferase
MYNHKDGINLRKIEKEDLPFLFEIKKESWWGTHKTLILNKDDQINWYNNIPENQLFMVGEDAETNEFVGVAVYTDIDWINRSLSISGSVIKNQRKDFAIKGFCAGLDFAFEILNMRRVEAEVLSYHKAAQFIEIEVLGFKVEGIKRQAVYKSGEYYDSIFLGILRTEWEKTSRVLDYKGCCNKNFRKYVKNKFKNEIHRSSR